MKIFLLIFFIISISTSCSNRKVVQSPPLDVITKQFIVDSLATKQLDRYELLFFIHPSFCGSCTTPVMDFIQKKAEKPYQATFILSAVNPSIESQLKTVPKSKIAYYNYDRLAQYGLITPYDQLFLLKNDSILYHNFVYADNLERIKSKIKKL